MSEFRPDDYESMIEPTREVSQELRRAWDDAGFIPAINGLDRIAAALMRYEEVNAGVNDAASFVGFNALPGDVKAALFQIASPQNEDARRDLFLVYPLLNFLFANPNGVEILNGWIALNNDEVTSPEGRQQYFDDLMSAFTKSNGEFQIVNTILTTSIIKAMLQDWYIKKYKYSKRKIHVEEYAQFLIDHILKTIKK